MSVWSRFTRFIKSIFGGAISAMENPRLILEQNIRELNDQVPKMNENIASVKANVILLQKHLKRAESEVAGLVAKVKAGIQAGRDDIAQRYALQLEKARESAASTREQLVHASAAYDKALQVKKAFMREKDRKIQEAKHALREHERAQWQSKIADTLEQFEVTGIDHTHDEMLQRLQEDTAHSEARLEMALDSADQDALRIEEDAEEIRASEIVKQLKAEMGMAEIAGDNAAEASDEEAIKSAKTIGKQRTGGA